MVKPSSHLEVLIVPHSKQLSLSRLSLTNIFGSSLEIDANIKDMEEVGVTDLNGWSDTLDPHDAGILLM